MPTDVNLDSEGATNTTVQTGVVEQPKSTLTDSAKDSIIADLRGKDASKRIEIRELKKQLASVVTPKIDAVEKPADQSGGRNYEVEFNQMKSQINQMRLKEIAKDKNVDPETLESLVRTRKIDVGASDADAEINALIEEKKLSRKAVPAFGSSAGDGKSSNDANPPKSISELMKRTGFGMS